MQGFAISGFKEPPGMDEPPTQEHVILRRIETLLPSSNKQRVEGMTGPIPCVRLGFLPS
jgi:hypothetical protein